MRQDQPGGTMTKEEYTSAIMDVAYLAACSVNGQTPDACRIEKMDLALLYKAASAHLLTGITAMALESAGIRDEAFTQAMGKAIRKTMLFNIERAAVGKKLEEAGIWYMPLKGAVLQSMYPKIGMRQMADNDILYDASRTEDVRSIMESLGFTTDQNFGKGNHDQYFKPPVCNFEMHKQLFGSGHDARITAYYQDVKSRLIPDDNLECLQNEEDQNGFGQENRSQNEEEQNSFGQQKNQNHPFPNKERSFGFHFSDEDFYIYLIAHEHKHYCAGGTGLRSLLDTYVYWKQKEKTLNVSYIEGELAKMGLSDFERQNRSLARKLFSGQIAAVEKGDELTETEQKMLQYFISSGTYGTLTNSVKNQIGKYGDRSFLKIRYILGRLILPLDTVRAAFPVFIKYPVLLPFLPFYRICRGLTNGRKRLRMELKILTKYKSDQK